MNATDSLNESGILIKALTQSQAESFKVLMPFKVILLENSNNKNILLQQFLQVFMQKNPFKQKHFLFFTKSKNNRYHLSHTLDLLF